MTKTEATKRARAHARFGWFRTSATEGYMRCPDCREHVPASWFPWAKPGETQTELVKALAEHFSGDECSKLWVRSY